MKLQYEVCYVRMFASKHCSSSHRALKEYFKCFHVSLLIIICSITIDYNTRIPCKNNAPEYLTITITYLSVRVHLQHSIPFVYGLSSNVYSRTASFEIPPVLLKLVVHYSH
jgi:hypothetical protein